MCIRLYVHARQYARRVAASLRSAVVREDGNTTEQIVLIALFVILAITVVAIITTKVIAKANSIDL